MNNFSQRTIREIAVEYPATARVFEKLGIDYCCGGRRNFVEVCTSNNLDPAQITAQLDIAIAHYRPPQTVPEILDVTSLVDYICSVHHAFTYKELDRLARLVDRVVREKGPEDHRLVSLSEDFFEMKSELIRHMKREEEILFPFIRELAAMDSRRSDIRRPPFGSVNYPIALMEDEHDFVTDGYLKIHSLTDNFTLQANAGPGVAALYHRLQALESDLHIHIHLENNVLFKKAAAIEKRVFREYNAVKESVI